jgi:DNA-binding response OmpR family regulator
MPTQKPRIVSVGCDALVFDSRNRVLESAGFEVVPCFSGERAAEICSNENFDLLLMCDSLPQSLREMLIHLLRNEKSATPIIMIYRMGELPEDLSFADAAVESLAGPERLIETVSFCLQKPAASAIAAAAVRQKAG